MSENTFKGKVVFIDPVKNASKTDKPFNVLSWGLDLSFVINGLSIANHVGGQTSNDKTSQWDNIYPGDTVEVEYSVRGQLKTKEMPATLKNPNSNVIFTNIDGHTVRLIERGEMGKQADLRNSSSGSNGAAKNFNPPTNVGAPSSSSEVKDDLPF